MEYESHATKLHNLYLYLLLTARAAQQPLPFRLPKPNQKRYIAREYHVATIALHHREPRYVGLTNRRPNRLRVALLYFLPICLTILAAIGITAWCRTKPTNATRS